MNIKIVRMGNDGEGIGFYNNKPVYIYYAFLNEEVEIDLYTNSRGVYQGTLTNVITPSEHRIEVDWPYYMQSGSINLAHINYLESLNYKRYVIKRLIDRRISNKITINKTIASDKITNYRNKTDIKVIYDEDGNHKAHYYRGSNNLFKVDSLIIEEEVLIKVVDDVLLLMNKHNINAYNFKNKKGSIVSLTVRCNSKNEVQLTFLTKKKVDLTNLVSELLLINENVISVYDNLVVNYKTNLDQYKGKLTHLKGSKHLMMKLNNYLFRLTPFSFFQLNTNQALKMFEYIVKNVSFTKDDVVLEAYSGVGVISTFISKYVKSVVAVEAVKEAVINMEESLKLNKITNVKPITGDFTKVISYLKTKFTKMIFDPPRIGLGKEVCEYVLKVLPKEIVYVSCNPLTLVDDLKILTTKYDVKFITPLDMFPLTSQIEAITLLTLKTNNS